MQKPPVNRKLASFGLLLASAALAVGTPAGTEIRNVATLTYTPEQGPTTTTESPPVTVTVSAVCRPSILPNGSITAPAYNNSIFPGESTLFAYTLTNAGNTTNTFALSAPVETSSSFVPSGVSIYQDTNNNGQVDQGEPAVSSITLAADATAQLLVRIDTAKASRGQSYVNLVAGCTTNVLGNPAERDDDNVSRVILLEPPDFVVDKTFNAPLIPPINLNAPKPPYVTIPGRVSAVKITAVNKGQGKSRAVYLTDFLNTPEMKDFVYMSGSANVVGGTNSKVQFTADGVNWVDQETSPVQGIRAVTDFLNPAEQFTLTFDLRTPQTEVGKRTNVARLFSSNTEVTDQADIIVKYNPIIFLGPINNARAEPGGELSESDTQRKTAGIVGQDVCFRHSVLNAGERPDTITTSGVTTIGSAAISFRDLSGAPIAEPFSIRLASGERRDFEACYTPSTAGGDANNPALRVLLTSKSALGAADNQTIDIVSRVENQNSKLLKTNDKGEGVLVGSDQQVTYTLSFTNNQSFALSNVVVTDNLQNINIYDTAGNVVNVRSVNFVSAEQGGRFEDGKVVWRFPSVAAGETLNLKLTVKVPSDLGDVSAAIVNTFDVTSSENPNKIPSPPSKNPIYDTNRVIFTKRSEPPVVRPGEAITYIFKVVNTSRVTPVNLLKIRDNLPAGLAYVEGSSTLDGAPITPVVPADNARGLEWTITSLAPGQSVEVRFRTLVDPTAPSDIKNTAVLNQVASDRTVKLLESSAVNKIVPLDFGPNNADIVGYVFLDRNSDGIYDHGLDVPYPNARVILSNGRTVLTDQWGRYNFRNIPEGTWALRLDPNSVSADNLRVPQDAGRPGSRLVFVRNLTSVDFPLVPDAGDIAVVRETTLRITGGPKGAQKTLTLNKQVFSTDERHVYRVQLALSASADLNALVVTDPLPEGAALVEGQNILNFETLPSGERVVSYRFRWTGDPNGAVTDPTASWRYE